MYIINYYLKEIRFRLFYLVFSFFVTSSYVYIFSDEFFYIITNVFFHYKPKNMLNEFNYINGWNQVQFVQNLQNHRDFIFTDIPEAFHTSITLALGLSLYFVVPFIVYHLWSFLLPSFWQKERKTFSTDCLFFLLFYLFASLTAYFIVFPVFWHFFLNFEILGDFVNIRCEARISSSISFLFKIYFLTHLLFKIPFMIFLLLKYKWLTLNFLFTNRRFLYFIIVITTALLSPPEIFTQCFLCLICILFFEICLFLKILRKIQRNVVDET